MTEKFNIEKLIKLGFTANAENNISKCCKRFYYHFCDCHKMGLTIEIISDINGKVISEQVWKSRLGKLSEENILDMEQLKNYMES